MKHVQQQLHYTFIKKKKNEWIKKHEKVLQKYVEMLLRANIDEDCIDENYSFNHVFNWFLPKIREGLFFVKWKKFISYGSSDLKHAPFNYYFCFSLILLFQSLIRYINSCYFLWLISLINNKKPQQVCWNTFCLLLSCIVFQV